MHSWHIGCADWNFDETSSATRRGLALPHLQQTSGRPRLLSMLLLACTIMFGSDRTSLLNSSGRFFFFFLSSCRKLRARVTRNREIKNSGLNGEKAFSEHDSIHGYRNLNYTERSAIARHRNFNAPKICKITVCSKITVLRLFWLFSPFNTCHGSDFSEIQNSHFPKLSPDPSPC